MLKYQSHNLAKVNYILSPWTKNHYKQVIKNHKLNLKFKFNFFLLLKSISHKTRLFQKKKKITSSTICPLLIVSCSDSWDIAIDLKVDPMLTCPQFALALSTFWHNELLLLPGPPVNIETSVFIHTQRSLIAFFREFPGYTSAIFFRSPSMGRLQGP